MPKHSSRKVVVQPDSVIEAEAIRSALVAAGIEAEVETQSMGTMFPHEAQAYGGIRVTVWAKDYPEAHEIVTHSAAPEPVTPTPDLHSDSKPFYDYNRAMKNATFCAIFGWAFLPAPIWGLASIRRAKQASPIHFAKEKWRVTLVLLLNGIALVCAAYLAYLYLFIQLKGTE